MSVDSKLTKVFNSSIEVPIDDTSKIVFMSDCHRGDSSWRDNLEPNRNIYYAALEHYYNKDFTYIEIGDGDELWENRNLVNIWDCYDDIFQIMYRLKLKKRLYMIFGNHDKMKSIKNYINKSKGDFIGKNLYEKLEIHEGIILKYTPTKKKIFITHGHQGDILNDSLDFIGKFGVRYIWSVLEGVFGFKNLTSPAKNYKKKSLVEKRIVKWIEKNKCMIIAGHTHRPHFPKVGQTPYFNDGCCVHPYSITCIELVSGYITLVKWKIKANDKNSLFAVREIISGPEKLSNYFDF